MTNPLKPNKLPRLTSWWLVAIALSALVFLIAPQQLPVSLYKLNLIALAAVAGYWIDRSIFFYARPNVDALDILAQYSQRPKPELVDISDLPADGDLVHGVEVSWPDHVPVYYFLGCMIRRAIIIAAAILAISLGA